MTNIEVTPIQYRKADAKRYRNGIRIFNLKTNQFKIVDCITLECVPTAYTAIITLEESVGNIHFKF